MKCSNCALPVPPVFHNEVQPDNGLSFKARQFGHESGFFDYYGHDPDEWFFLCHDCCVLLFTTMTGLAQAIGVKGGHPNMNEHDVNSGTLLEPCCPFCWTINVKGDDYEAFLVGEDGSWVAPPSAPEQDESREEAK